MPVKKALAEKIAGEITLSPEPGATIRKWRAVFAVNQTDLAEHLDVTPSVISDYEAGRRKSPGIATIRRIVESLIALDERSGGKTIAKYTSLMDPGEGILAINEYPRAIAAHEFVEAIDGRMLVESDRLGEKRVQGYTLIDSVKAIASLGAADYARVYGWSTERALIFTGISYGRSPMIAVRVHPMKPALVVYHRPKDVDPLAEKLAKFENIPLVVTELELEKLRERLDRFS